MKVQDIPIVTENLISMMSNDGYNKNTIEITRWITGLFKKYCDEKRLADADISTAAVFFEDRFALDLYSKLLPTQSVIRRPLLSLFEFEESGSYLHFHPRSNNTKTPVEFSDVFFAYRDTVNKRDLAYTTKSEKIWRFSKHLEYIREQGITDTRDIEMRHLYEYFSVLKEKYAHQTVIGITTTIREIYDWMYDGGYVKFSGKAALPYIRKDTRDRMLSYYSREEIDQILSCIDTETVYGKFSYAVICLFAHLGLRSGDVVRLKFSDVDWNKNQISIIQQKTNTPLVLPLIEEVKYPLLDYIKNARPHSIDEDYIFISINAPHRRYSKFSSLYRVVAQCMEIAGIQYEGRHHGPHALRHSLATMLMNNNVPISGIANVLGHKTTKATEHYLTVDETNLKELTLEVPNE